MVKLTWLLASRPVLVFVVLVTVELIVPSIMIENWFKTTKSIKENVDVMDENLRRGMVSELENIGRNFYQSTSSSAIGLAHLIHSSLVHNNTSSAHIQSLISPVLYEAYRLIPHVSQVSYIASDGIFLSFFTDYNRTVVIFSNTTFSSDYIWYTQDVDQTNGRLYGDAFKSRPLDLNRTEWFQAALSNDNVCLGPSWGIENVPLFFNTVSLHDKKGSVSLGFRVQTLIDVLNQLNLYGGDLFLSTKEGTVLLRGGSPNASFFVSNGSACFHTAPKSPRSRNKNEDQCFPSNNATVGYDLVIDSSKFRVYSSVLEVAGIHLVYALVFPSKGDIVAMIEKNRETGLILLVLTSMLPVISTLIFVMLMVRAARKEMHMCATLINQMEATQQAERKSMNKSLAFASASHDIRGALAGINGLIDLCQEEAEPGCELDTSLKQMQVCTHDLLGLLNSILDMSKIESGKMQVEEEEFNLADLLEEVVDSFHPVAMKKGVDVIFDLQDGSILMYSNVKGDRGKLKQILNNLVSNAVKFTFDGHVSIRAWAQKPSSQSSIVLAANADGDVWKFSRFMLCNRKDTASNKLETVEPVRSVRGNMNMNTMEFVFEVDDTGKGIPKEMQKSVFENYVQVRETAQGQQGTGLGLGIVQSLVRLMGGEIRIVDKDIGQKGTCFRFNIFLTTSESPTNDTAMRQDKETKGDCLSTPNLGTSSANRSIRSMSPRLNSIFLSSSPRSDGSRVVLLLKDEERRRVTQKYMESLGINVTVVEKWEHLDHVLERMKSKLNGSSPQNSFGKSETSSRSEISRSNSKALPLSAMDGIDRRSQLPTKKKYSLSRFVLLVIDANTGSFYELSSTVQQFRDSLHRGICCKVVWLNKRDRRTRGWENDVSFLKPLHGSRLNKVMKMLPEFGGTVPKETPFELQREPSLRYSLDAEMSLKNKMLVNTEMQEEGSSSSYDRKLGKTRMISSSSERETDAKRRFTHSVRTVKPAGNTENIQETPEPSDGKCLAGKKVLVVDDQKMMALIASKKLMKLGASTVEKCYNGKEAVRLVKEQLEQRDRATDSMDVLPFDYIFMDCQMPEMDGYEATRQIRRAESRYGIHVPIIAISAHEHGSKEAKEAIEAGMDAHLGKELLTEHLVNVIKEIKSKMTAQYIP
ncbi:PREDICTED: LOW QUALITY PROTEIN: histidine kinase CKI1-like [Tarenaya hassleriana]|uniref:LOW QUALITY PROTEIN: histidine kinase CKI1-like n=1 Tax=Tarenaya hassleriana TaxID=28532 RepID=UPI0008FCEA70|nr:PREDICTED: LOW QUALITY PROTEIN: histidine kinase CKI1-like [Tarenaya hassleriana]